MSSVEHTNSGAAAARAAAPAAAADAFASWQAVAKAVLARVRRPELWTLVALAGVLNLWALGRNGWANTYYSAAVRSMSASWHNFLFASLDPSGVMTVDKPPLSLWVQALSARIFGYHPLSLLIPQALEGMAAVALTYDLVRRRFGRAGGFVAGLALSVTPITVAISRHNNPDALLTLCSVAALWCAVRAVESRRAGWLVAAGACVGLGFETKMGVALTVVPGIAAAWLLTAPKGRRRRSLGQLAGAGAVMTLIGGAWPALVELTPASSRPWISGTSDNSALSLIFGYNGLGRVDGQVGGPGGGPAGGSLFGGSPGPLRLLSSSLGGQAGWLLGFAIVAGLGMLAASRLRRSDPRTGWLVATGGAFATTAVLFSAASGIFHPYYVSLLAPFTAALVGAGAAELLGGRMNARIVGPLAIAAAVASELAVLGDYPGQLTWLVPLLIGLGSLTALALLAGARSRVRLFALAAALAALLVAPSAWAIDTLGHATSGTFPAGGPASAELGAPGGGMGAGFGRRFGLAARGLLSPPRAGGSAGVAGAPPAGPAAGRAGATVGTPPGAPPWGFSSGGPAAGGPAGAPPASFGRSTGRVRFAGAGGASRFGGQSLTAVLTYVQRHGGGTLAVASQSSAASAIIGQDAAVAGIGGFSGRESTVSVAWLAQNVRSGKIRWVLAEALGADAGGPRLPADTRAGSRAAMAIVARACRSVTLSASASRAAGSASPVSAVGTLYDCQGRAASILNAGAG
jgi:4-amino-4-deoxy-L-arabinose transferase-like glycosyltransferase